MLRTPKPILYALIAVGSIAGLFGAWKRFHVENLNRRVELTLDYTEVKNLAQSTGRPFPAVLAQFKQAGITSLAITEDSLSGLETQGNVVLSRLDGFTTAHVDSDRTLERVRAAFAMKGLPVLPDAPASAGAGTFISTGQPMQADGVKAAVLPHRQVFLPNTDYAAIRQLGIGLDPDAVAAAHAGGFAVVGRISNYPGATQASMEQHLLALKNQGVRTVVFQGLEVLGYRDLTKTKPAAGAFTDTGLKFGQIEFGKQKGDEKLGADLKGDFVRVHSIGDAEAGTMDENEMIERFVRGARERNIRLCYIHLETLSGADPVATNVRFIGKIARGIARKHEMAFGVARPFAQTGTPRLLFPIIALGVAGGVVLLLISVVPLAPGRATAALLGAVVVCVGLALLGDTGRKLDALIAALVFPTIACLRRDILGAPERGFTKALSVGQAAGAALRGMTVASAVTALGIAQVVGLLATRPFMVKADQFLGIKAAHALPILFIGLLAITTLPALDIPWEQEWRRIRANVSAFLSEPTRIGPMVLTLVALVALAVVVARTGNDSGVGVSGMELKFRAVLDRILPVRPRTKEFLVGHPAFFLALAFWFRGRRKVALPLFVVGVVGQVSILNTFCHIHTPLFLSFVRDVIGLVFGAFIGWVIFLFVERLVPTPAQAARMNMEKAQAGR